MKNTPIKSSFWFLYNKNLSFMTYVESFPLWCALLKLARCFLVSLMSLLLLTQSTVRKELTSTLCPPPLPHPLKDIQTHCCCGALLWGLGWFSCMLTGTSCCSTSSCVSMHSLFPTSKRWNTSWNTGFGTWAASCANCFTSFTRTEKNAEVGTVFCHWPCEKSCQRRCLWVNDASGLIFSFQGT